MLHRSHLFTVLVLMCAVCYRHFTEYTYAADGRKLRTVYKMYDYSIIFNGGAAAEMLSHPLTITTRDYCGNYVYRNDTLERVMTDVGYIDGATRLHHAFVHDYRGNVRAVVRQDGTLVEYNAYYPYGMLMTGSAASTSNFVTSPTGSVQPYKYTGKELDRENGLDTYDFEARCYDPALATTWQQDPLADKYTHLSPYSWCADNPIRNTDPTGMDYYSVDKQGNIELILQNDDEQDRIYSMNNGKIDGNNYIDVGKEFMGSEISATITANSFTYGDRLNDQVSVYQGADLGLVYKFMCEHTSVEWSYLQYLKDGQHGMTALGTSHEGTDSSASYIVSKVLAENDVLIQMNHFHSLGSTMVSQGDIDVAKDIVKRHPNVRFFIDVANWENSPIEYDINSKTNEFPEVIIVGNYRK